MKFKFRNLWRDIVYPVGLSVGTLLLFGVIFSSAFDGKDGLLVATLLVVVWGYGIAFVQDVLPFWKRVFRSNGGKKNG